MKHGLSAVGFGPLLDPIVAGREAGCSNRPLRRPRKASSGRLLWWAEYQIAKAIWSRVCFHSAARVRWRRKRAVEPWCEATHDAQFFIRQSWMQSPLRGTPNFRLMRSKLYAI